MSHLRIGIIGNGVVGNATARTWMEHAEEVRVYDQQKVRCTHSIEQLLLPGVCGLDKLDLIFICLPEDKIEVPFLANLPYGWDRNANLVIKSTVPIGTTRRLREQYQLPNLVHSPEFLTARCAVADAQLPAQLIIGEPAMRRMSFCPPDMPVITPRPWTTCGCMLRDAYYKRFPGVPIRFMTPDESEAVKLFLNSAFAVKVAFFNELNLLAEKLGLDWQRVLEGMLGDGRITNSHTKVPGPDGKYGFGGACLPKDLKQLCDLLEDNELGSFVCKGAYCRNVNDRKRGAE